MEGNMMIRRNNIVTNLVEIIRLHPLYLFLISILFGILGAFVDAVIDYLFFYEVSLLEAFLPKFDSHEFYMRVMLIFTLASFSILVVFLLKRLDKYYMQLRSVNEHLEETISQRAKEFGDLFSQSPIAKALLSKDFEIIDTNEAWNDFFQFDKSLINGANILNNKHFASEGIRQNLLSIRDENKLFKSESLYFEELDKILILSVYAITNNINNVVKIVCNLDDITDKLKLHESDKELEIQKITMKTIIDLIERERARLSSELHDEVGQQLMISKLHLELLKKDCNVFPEKFDEVTNLLQNTSGNIKKILYALHPPELKNYGLVNSIQSRINHCFKIGNFKVDFKTYGKYLPLKEDIELCIYRICQEAFSNIIKHSQASNVLVEINFNSKLITCIIQDDGCGFNIDDASKSNGNKKYGLVSMRERAKILGGTLDIETDQNIGSKIYLEIPLVEDNNG
jgi:two-component system, NarL family, sensor histidine kinase DegS